jgi:MoaA/NifB/PqqE/SkfB family radical SAM enzyme
MDIKLGNICNFQCRICGSHSSNKLIKEEIAFVSPHAKSGHIAHTYKKRGLWPRQSPTFWEDLKALLPTVLNFEITGGEPFLIKEQFELLQFAVDCGEAHHIELHYNTNGSTWPENGPDIWKHFKALTVAFSIDNVDKRFEFERKNGSWPQTLETIRKMHEFKHEQRLRSDKVANINTQICLTVNIQNVYYLKELCDWGLTQDFDHFYFNMLHYPPNMSIANMTPQAQFLVIDKLESEEFAPQHQRDIDNIIQFIENGEGSDGKEFAKRMYMFDTSRGEDFANLYPEMAEAMRYKDHIKPKHFCMAPWVHTYISPQSERRMCCASREPAQNFKQYIDTKGSDGQYNPVTIQEHWNRTAI